MKPRHEKKKFNSIFGEWVFYLYALFSRAPKHNKNSHFTQAKYDFRKHSR